MLASASPQQRLSRHVRQARPPARATPRPARRLRSRTIAASNESRAVRSPTTRGEDTVAVITENNRTQERVEAEQDEEELKERLEREHGELLEELRALIPGAQVLFGFLLAIRFTGQFTDLDSGQKYVYYATLLSTAVALVLLLAPAAHHRLRFREGDKDFMLRKGNREAIAGSFAIALAFTGALYVVTDLTFNLSTAVAVSAVFFSLIVWRWWAYGVYRTLTDR